MSSTVRNKEMRSAVVLPGKKAFWREYQSLLPYRQKETSSNLCPDTNIGEVCFDEVLGLNLVLHEPPNSESALCDFRSERIDIKGKAEPRVQLGTMSPIRMKEWSTAPRVASINTGCR
jgi:hypothetical protein